MGQRDIRRLLITGASAVVTWAARKGPGDEGTGTFWKHISIQARGVVEAASRGRTDDRT